jgi:hypothetical protein
MSEPTFGPGQVVATPGCLAALAEAGQTAHELLARHLTRDWGDLGVEDAARNDAALADGSRILSAYPLRTGVRIWVITEAVGDDGRRSSTCLLLPDEY